jgi:transposase
MKYKQSQKNNQRIQSITSQDLVVGMDVAKWVHVARAVDERGLELGQGLSFENNQPGFLNLMNWIQSLQVQFNKQRVVIGIEPTGHYWFPLAEFLHKQGIKLVTVNPAHVNRSKEFADNSQTKNDYKDARVIADLIRNGHYTEPKLLENQYADLRVYMTYREKMMDQLGQVQRRIYRWLDRYFPEFTEVFSSWEGRASLIVLKEFPFPTDIVELGAERIAKRWKQDINGVVGLKRAKCLVQYAQQSIGMREGMTAARTELKGLLEQYDLYQRQIEEMMVMVEQLLAEMPGADEILSIPGVGVVTVAGILAEVGDLRDFEHGQQLVRMAGLNLKENSSGAKKGRTSISKRGRARLRTLFYRAVISLLANNVEFKALHKYFTTRSENPLKKKQSIIAMCGKFARVIHTLVKKRMYYDPTLVLGVTRQIQLQEAA